MIQEANVFILWGSMSLKLLDAVAKQLGQLSIQCILHIRGCENRVDNSVASSSLANVLPVNSVLSKCQLDSDDYMRLIIEARQCLRA